MLRPDLDAAVEFLELFRPDGPWLLNSIDPDLTAKNRFTAVTFRADETSAIREWVGEQNKSGRNIYFGVNPTIQPISTKAKREDILQMDWCHVDIDAGDGQSVDDAQAGALKGLNSRKDGIPLPTAIINSGGGIQAFWRLKEPVRLNGDIGRCEEAKRHNQRLEIVFGGDRCHNVDRVMRLPGTVNWPNEEKKKKGRVPVMAACLEFHPERSYDAREIPPLQAVQIDSGAFTGSAPDVNISGNIERVTDLDTLDQWNVPDRTKVLIIHGRHPDEPAKEKDNSRSAWLFDTLCSLCRCAVPVDVIFSLITDPDYRISESVREKKNSEQYAKRQIQRALEWTKSPELEMMNSKHAVIGNYGGKVVVVEEVWDESLGRSQLLAQSPGMVRERYRHIKVQVGRNKDGDPIYQRLGHWWLDSNSRRQYESLVFEPGKDIPNTYNLWRGFACEALPGHCDLLMEHIKNNVCSGNIEYYTYLICWMARAVQRPDLGGEVAVVLRGERGVGKSFLAEVFGSLFGRHSMTVSDPKHLVGSFNAHLRDLCVLFADEAFFAGDKKHEGVLKTIITGKTISIELKGYDVQTVRNRLHLVMASNESWVVPAGKMERRFFVLDVHGRKQQDTAYFAELHEELESGGREAFLYFLQSVDLSEFSVFNVPQTKALQEQKEMTLSAVEGWWYEKLRNGRLLDHHAQWEAAVECKSLMKDFVDECRDYGHNRRGSQTQLGKFIQRICSAMHGESEVEKVQRHVTRNLVHPETGQSYTKVERPYFYVFPNLERCRLLWASRFGETEWPQPIPFDPQTATQKEKDAF